MQNFYVKKQENSKYLENVQLQPQEDYTQLAQINDDQKVKLLNFTTKCFLNENGALVVPGQVPDSDEELDKKKMQATIDDLKTKHQTDSAKIQDLSKQNDQHEEEINNLKTQAQMSSKITNSLITKINSLGGNGQQTADDAGKQADQNQNGGNK